MAQQNEPLVQPEELDMPDDEVLYELADLFRVFGDSTPHQDPVRPARQ